ncbi:MAG TPA: cytochrome c1 [Acetobacteraceae bacterium]|nr:cytochrome c1 [Acetobacteraceae bacterium]
MMGAIRGLLAGLATVLLVSGPALAQQEPPLPNENWSFSGLFGSFDLASAQRGFWVFQNVCSNCHSLKQIHYRDLAAIGLTEAQIKAVAGSVQVPKGVNNQGEPVEGPATPADQFRSPFPNEEAARAAMNGALPPDLSLIVNAREGHADYVYGILNGFVDPPAGFTVPPGRYYNQYFPGHLIAMPPPLHDGLVEFADGTKATVPQMAHDVVTYLEWAANPEMAQRKQIGVRVILFLLLLMGLTYALKRKVWADVH